MKIEKVRIENFRGKQFEFAPKKINLLLEPNGYGKSTVMDAVRYGLTGLMPKDNVRNMAVELSLEHGADVYRSRGEKTECRFNGERVTVSALNDALVSRFGIPLDTFNAAGSSEILFAKSPAELLQLLLRYIPERLTLDGVMMHFEGFTDEIYNECAAFVPESEEFGIEKLTEIYNHFYELRREEKAKLAALKELIGGIRATKPTRPAEAVEEELVNLLKNSDGAQTAELLKDYNEKKKKRDEQDKLLAALRERLKESTDTIPTDEQLNIIETKRQQAEKAKLEHTGLLSTVCKNIDLYQRTLDSLDKPVCPISSKLVCTTDKTGIRGEMKTLLKENLEAKEKHEYMIRRADALLEKCRNSKSTYDRLKKKHDEFLRINAQIEAYEKNLVTVPPEPVKTGKAEEFEAAKKKLQDEKKNLEEYLKGCKLTKEAKVLMHKIEIHDAIIKAFSDKGVIKNRIVEYYLDFFEGACNSRAAELGIGYRIRFLSNNGVHILAKADSNMDGDFYPVASLSNGESILTSFLLMDMLAQCSGTRLMFIDNIEALDAGNLAALSGLIRKREFRDSYDHVFIGGVNHNDVVAAIMPGGDDPDVLLV